jgi:RNA polymerase sigma-70 factor (ECF subfamily)
MNKIIITYLLKIFHLFETKATIKVSLVVKGGTILEVLEATNIEELLTEIYEDTYDDVLKYVISKCRSGDNIANDIADLMQNIYLSFYKVLKSNRPIQEPKKYLITIARNEVFKHYGILKMAKSYIPVFSYANEEDFKSFQMEINKESDYSEKLLCDQIWEYLKHKDMLTFKIFVLYFNEDLKIKDISTSLNVSESTVKNRLYRTMKEINSKFEL